LFNALTGASAYAADQLFATLDPTVRRIALPGGGAVLADTVGFVRDLPHELVAAFRSTLSEAREADLLLHVVDAADPLREERIRQVDEVLADIGAGDLPQLLVFNKIDRLEREGESGEAWTAPEPRHDRPGEGRQRVWVSAQLGLGLDLLRKALAEVLELRHVVGEVRLPSEAARLHARLHAIGAIREEVHDEQGWLLHVDMAIADAQKLYVQAHGEALRPLLDAVGALEDETAAW
jgi:GTPase